MLWLLLSLALAHPGADGHHTEGCDDLPALLRYAQALTTDARFEEAHRAIRQAADCGADPAETDLATGTTLLAERRPADALPFLERAVGAQPTPATLITRADAYDAVGRPGDAAADRLAAIDRTATPGPDLYLAAARSLAAADRSVEAVQVLDRGIAAVGAVPSLVRLAVELAEPEDALRRLEAVEPTPQWLALRADALVRAGRAEEARAALEQALAAARAARPSPRRTQQVAVLEAALAGLEAP